MSKPTEPSRRRTPDLGLSVLVALAAGSGIAATAMRGPSAITEALRTTLADAAVIAPIVACGIIVGALFSNVVPRDLVSKSLGNRSGTKGVILATGLGAIMPGGPFVAFPLVLALGRSGAGTGALVAFVTAWSVIGLNRLLVWELPFMGAEFAILRALTSLPLPIIAGLLARHLSTRFGGVDL